MSTNKTWPWPPNRNDTNERGQQTKSTPQPWTQIHASKTAVVECEQTAAVHAEATQEIVVGYGQAASLSVAHGETTPPKKGLAPPWKPGQSGNIKGRPKGSKQKLSEAVRSIVLKDVIEHGAEVLAHIRQQDPTAYWAFVLKIVPAELILQLEKGLQIDCGNLTDEQFCEVYTEQERRQKFEWAMDNAYKSKSRYCRKIADRFVLALFKAKLRKRWPLLAGIPVLSPIFGPANLARACYPAHGPRWHLDPKFAALKSRWPSHSKLLSRVRRIGRRRASSMGIG